MKYWMIFRWKDKSILNAPNYIYVGSKYDYKIRSTDQKLDHKWSNRSKPGCNWDAKLFKARLTVKNVKKIENNILKF